MSYDYSKLLKAQLRHVLHQRDVTIAQLQADIVRLKDQQQEAAVRVLPSTDASVRQSNWQVRAAAAQEYCRLHGVRSVSIADLDRFIAEGGDQ